MNFSNVVLFYRPDQQGHNWPMCHPRTHHRSAKSTSPFYLEITVMTWWCHCNYFWTAIEELPGCCLCSSEAGWRAMSKTAERAAGRKTCPPPPEQSGGFTSSKGTKNQCWSRMGESMLRTCHRHHPQGRPKDPPSTMWYCTALCHC